MTGSHIYATAAAFDLPLARFAPRWPIYLTEALIARRHRVPLLPVRVTL